LSFSAIRLIAIHEFSSIVRNPLVIVSTIAICVLIIINGAASSVLLPSLKLGFKEVFILSVSNASRHIALVLSFLVLCLSIITISKERSNGSLRVLMTKPLYRRDIIIGKLLGINTFILLLDLFLFMICISSITISYGGPESISVVLKLITFALIVYIFSAFMAGIMLLFGIALKNLSIALVSSLSFLYLVWYLEVPTSIDSLWAFSPVRQYMDIVVSLIGSQSQYSNWLDGAMPSIIFMILEAIAIFLVDCYLFNKEET
jgi:ABC-2 type transport system permease protein